MNNLKKKSLIIILIGILYSNCLFLTYANKLNEALNENDNTIKNQEHSILTYGRDFSTSIIESIDGNFIVAGYSECKIDVKTGGIRIDSDAILLKIDKNGEFIWNKVFQDFRAFTQIIQTSDDNFAIIGIEKPYWVTEGFSKNDPISSNSELNDNTQLYKLDDNGILLWNKTYKGLVDGAAFFATSLLETSDLGFLIAGEVIYMDNDSINPNIFLVKTDNNGTIEWTKEIKTSTSDYFSSITETSDGGFAILGTIFEDEHDSADIWFGKIDCNGNMQWEYIYEIGYTYFFNIHSLIETTDNGFAITSSVIPYYGDLSYEIHFIKTNSSGMIEWEHIYNLGQDSVYGLSLGQTSDLGYILTGQCDYLNRTVMFLLKINQIGEIEWNQYYISEDLSGGFRAIQTSDDTYVIVGYKDNENNDLYASTYAYRDILIVKTDKEGNLEWNLTYGVSAFSIIPESPDFTDEFPFPIYISGGLITISIITVVLISLLKKR